MFAGRREAVLAGTAFALSGLSADAAWADGVREIDGTELPPIWPADGLALRLNGAAVRTYSIFRVRIYMAALYLEQPSRDAETILRSDTAKLLLIRFLHDVSAERSRDAWVRGFEQNCRAPCHLSDDILSRFLASMPDFRRGDQSTLLFAGRSVQITVNARVMGTIDDAGFARAMLANFIGPYPPSETFKLALLGQRD